MGGLVTDPGQDVESAAEHRPADCRHAAPHRGCDITDLAGDLTEHAGSVFVAGLLVAHLIEGPLLCLGQLGVHGTLRDG